MGISQYIKEIGRGKDGARSLTREQAADLFGQVLDGTVTDLEVGGFCLAMRIKGETPEEMAGFPGRHAPAPAAPARQRPHHRGAAQLQRCTQAAGAHAAAGAAAGPPRRSGAGARHGHRRPARHQRSRVGGAGHCTPAVHSLARSARARAFVPTEVLHPASSACWTCAARSACATRRTAWSS
jgi:hypothetical protein